MKITITIPEGVYKKLEEDRGLIPRSTYIQQLIKDNDEVVEVTTKTDGEEFEVGEELSTEVTQDELIKEIKAADKMGNGENWERVKGMAREAGYEWDGRTKELLKDGRVVWKAY